jgi:hypothetical protein
MNLIAPNFRTFSHFLKIGLHKSSRSTGGPVSGRGQTGHLESSAGKMINRVAGLGVCSTIVDNDFGVPVWPHTWSGCDAPAGVSGQA